MVNSRPVIFKEQIFSQIQSLDIFKRYVQNFVFVDKHFLSEFRRDTKPSCCISFINGDYLYHDFGTGESHGAIGYVMRKFGITYREALELIVIDFKIDLHEEFRNSFANYSSYNNSIIAAKSNREPTKRGTIIKVIRRKDSQGQYTFRPEDLQYWEDFWWTEWMLRQSKTWAISHYILNNHKTNYHDVFYNVERERAFDYDYYEHKGIMRRKLYFPDRQDFRWVSNVDNTTVQLVDVMPKEGDILFITSSKKDAGIFWRIQLEKMVPDLVIHGVAPNNEGSCVPFEWLCKKKLLWKRIILWYNNDWHKLDNPGVTNAKKFAEKYDLEYFYNPDNTPKDPSDFSKKNGLIEFGNLMKELL